MKVKKLVLGGVILCCIVLITIPFWNKRNHDDASDLLPGVHKVIIREILQTSRYTYLRVAESENEYWMAVTKREAGEGDVIYYTNPLVMNNFISHELGRTFDTILFVQDVSDQPIVTVSNMPQTTTERKMDSIIRKDVKIERIKDGITISELYENHANYAGKTVKIRGVVTKYNAAIMGRNWVHIQDGTNFAGNFDLPVTTFDSISLDQTVTFTGLVTLNKDFGSGYFFRIILEGAKATDIEPLQ